MADKPAPKKSTGRTVGYVALGIGGLVAAYLAYRWYENNVAGSTSSTAPATTGTTPTAGPASSATTPITTITEWRNAIIAAMVASNVKGGENTAATAVSDALSGHCLGPNEYAALNSALGSVGQPPGTGVLTLAQCKPKARVTTTHTPSETPSKATAASKAHVPSVASRRKVNAIDAARRRANDIAAATRRRAQHLKPPVQAK